MSSELAQEVPIGGRPCRRNDQQTALSGGVNTTHLPNAIVRSSALGCNMARGRAPAFRDTAQRSPPGAAASRISGNDKSGSATFATRRCGIGMPFCKHLGLCIRRLGLRLVQRGNG
mmetsp:Transcript_59504/g.164586  ORF Transcript_59504/g.164586 Transcript_59504/m.164586 type:complete len:116 (-) Transcript_59504:27-374(-)